MSGMNLMFHLASAAAAALLTYLLLSARRQADFARELLLGLRRAGARRVRVEPPAAFLEKLAATFGVAFENEGAAGDPARITPGPLTEMLLRGGLQLIRCKDKLVELHVSGEPEGDAAGLGAALGGQVQVKIVPKGA